MSDPGRPLGIHRARVEWMDTDAAGIYLRFGEEVETRVELLRLGRSSMTFGFEVWRDTSDGRPRRRAARGSYVTVHVPDKENGGSAPWPAAWRASLARGAYQEVESRGAVKFRSCDHERPR